MTEISPSKRPASVGLDLVEVSPTSDPPVCRIMDYGKWLYEQKRKTREARKKTHHAGGLKEIRLRPETDQHDIDIKVKHAREFIEKGHKVQFTLVFRGRQLAHQDKGHEILNKIIESMSDVAKVDQQGRLLGKRMHDGPFAQVDNRDHTRPVFSAYTRNHC